MKIDEALNGLQGLNNNGGEMPRVRKAKKIKKIKPDKPNKNFKEMNFPKRKGKKKGPLNIDLSKLGEQEMERDSILSNLKEKYASKKYAKTSDKNTFRVEPNTGHESPNKTRGKFVGEADPDPRQRQSVAAKMQGKRDAARQQNIVFDHEAFRQYMVKNHGTKTYKAIDQNLVKYQMEFQNAQAKGDREAQLRQKNPDYSELDTPAFQRKPKYNTKVSNNPIDSAITRGNYKANNPGEFESAGQKKR
tara:strand:+ start:5403 stop:6143 length:741 start_codon:yes stop_codon:yes gene_type:complete